MKQRTIKPGFTLIEMMLVVAIAALMMAIAMPNIPGMIRDNQLSSAKNLIKTALDQAQSYAASHSKYAGIRFQKAANGDTYLVLIEHESQFDYNTDETGNTNSPLILSAKNPKRFVAIKGAKPRALPSGVSVIDGFIFGGSDNMLYDYAYSNNGTLCIENYQTFSIIFSPTGQLVTKQVSVYPRYDENIKTMVGYSPPDPVNFPHNGSQYASKLNASAYGGYDNVYPADTIFTSMMYCDPQLYSTLTGTSIDPYLINNSDGLLSYDAHWVPEIGDYSYNTAAYNYAYVTLPWCGNSATIIPATPNSYSCYSEQSATGFFMYLDKQMDDASPDGLTRYSSFFSLSEGESETIGCEYYLLNRFTGDFFAN